MKNKIKLMKRQLNPNIAYLYKIIQTDDQIIFVLKFARGLSTHNFLKSKQDIGKPENDARRIYKQMIIILLNLLNDLERDDSAKSENIKQEIQTTNYSTKNELLLQVIMLKKQITSKTGVIGTSIFVFLQK